MFIAFRHITQNTHLLFSVLQSRILQTEEHNSGSVFGVAPGRKGVCVGPGSVFCLAPLLLAKPTPVVLLLGYLGVLERFSDSI